MSLTQEQPLNALDQSEIASLVPLIKKLNSSGHNPATSGNYSLRSNTHPDLTLVSESGIDKSIFSENHFLLVNIESGKLHRASDFERKPSDETALHLTIYQNTKAKCVLHSHLLESLVFADLYPHDSFAAISGLELLKGLQGIKSHNTEIRIPIFENSQNILKLASDIQLSFSENNCLQSSYIFLLRGHGFYVWGASVKEAKRHLEVFEYLFKYTLMKNKLKF